MIKATGLTKRYNGITAIDNLTFEIQKGEIIGFLGPNGAGKTTTMKILTCFMPPTHGSATINGLSIADNSYSIRQKIGYLPENNPLYTEMTVLDYLEFIANIRKIPLDKQFESLERVIDLCGLNDVLTKSIDECSKGYCQRVGLAQALIHKPDILILDEPTVGLDPNQIIEIRKLIKTLGKDTTILMCSHILSEVSATCSRVFILKNGKIIADDTPAHLTSQAKGEKKIYLDINTTLKEIKDIVQTLKENIRNIEQVSKDQGFIKVKIQSKHDIRTQLFNLAVEKKWVIRELTMEETSLEDVFIDLTGNSK